MPSPVSFGKKGDVVRRRRTKKRNWAAGAASPPLPPNFFPHLVLGRWAGWRRCTSSFHALAPESPKEYVIPCHFHAQLV